MARWMPATRPTSLIFFFSSRRRHTRFDCDWSSDVCSSDLERRGCRRRPARRQVAHAGGRLDPRAGRAGRPAADVSREPLPRLHAITDERIARRADLDDVARELAAGGGADLALHARGRLLSGLEHYELANRLTAYPPTRLFVNDRLDVALGVGGGAGGGHRRLD